MLSTQSPAMVPTAAATPLSRWALWLLCVVYVLPGYVGREPWKTLDVLSFAAMMELAQGGSSWWQPTLVGLPISDPAPLLYALGAALLQLAPAGATWAYQLPTLLALLVTLYATWHATFRFALTPAAQPMAFAFGGQASPLNYARSVADSAALALVACLGFAQISHEVGPAVLWAMAVALMLLGASQLFNTRTKHPYWRWWAWHATGAAVLSLTHQWALAGGLTVWAVYWAFSPHPLNQVQSWQRWGWPLCIAFFTLCLAAWSPLTLRWSSSRWASTDPMAFLQLVSWFTWPAWPLAMWTAWKWKHQLRSGHIGIPMSLVGTGVLASILDGGSDRTLLMILPPLAVLAAFALPTLKRSAGALIDWFSLLFFSFSALAIWVVWIAMQTGIPATPARNVARLAPGFIPTFEPLAFALAVAASLAWLWVVTWRTSHHPTAMWKSLVIPASGAVLGWLLLTTLWLPLLNHARGYSGMMSRLSKDIPAGNCATGWNLQEAQLAALQWQANLQMRRGTPATAVCEYLIASHQQDQEMFDDHPNWVLLVRSSRLTDDKETLSLWQRKPESLTATTH